jgi:hypothetical protein
MARASQPRHGVKLQYANPATGGYPLPTIGAFLQLLPKGFAGRPYRSTDATVFCVAEGSGSTTIGDRTFTWTKRDIFVVPSWHPVSHTAREESVLFSFGSARAKSAGIWRGNLVISSSGHLVIAATAIALALIVGSRDKSAKTCLATGRCNYDLAGTRTRSGGSTRASARWRLRGRNAWRDKPQARFRAGRIHAVWWRA